VKNYPNQKSVTSTFLKKKKLLKEGGGFLPSQRKKLELEPILDLKNE